MGMPIVPAVIAGAGIASLGVGTYLETNDSRSDDSVGHALAWAGLAASLGGTLATGMKWSSGLRKAAAAAGAPLTKPPVIPQVAMGVGLLGSLVAGGVGGVAGTANSESAKKWMGFENDAWKAMERRRGGAG